MGHSLRPDVVQRSALLAGLSEADGLASLPEDLGPEEVQLWEAARHLGIAPSTEELVTLLKVMPCNV